MGLPIQPRKKHLIHILDLAIIAGLFVAAGQMYLKTKGVAAIERKRVEREAARLEGVRQLEEADSVVTATKTTLTAVMEDSVMALAELQNLRLELERKVGETQQLEQGIYRLSDVVLDMRERSELAVKQAQRDVQNADARATEVESLRTTSVDTREDLLSTRQERQQAALVLVQAKQAEEYDPKGVLPAGTGVAIRQDIGEDSDVTNLVVQHVFWRPPVGSMDMGVSLGFGLGSGNTTSNKEVGLLLTRSLIHRRLGLDLGAGYSILGREDGDDESTPYAAAGLRISPFYKERLHLGVGARANSDEVAPFVGFTVGRR